MAELRGLGAVHEALQKRGGALLAISADTPGQAARVIEKNDLAFPVLGDPQLKAVDAFGVRHENGKPGGGDIALPAHFLVDRKGNVVWRWIGAQTHKRPNPAELLKRINSLGPP